VSGQNGRGEKRRTNPTFPAGDPAADRRGPAAVRPPEATPSSVRRSLRARRRRRPRRWKRSGRRSNDALSCKPARRQRSAYRAASLRSAVRPGVRRERHPRARSPAKLADVDKNVDNSCSRDQRNATSRRPRRRTSRGQALPSRKFAPPARRKMKPQVESISCDCPRVCGLRDRRRRGKYLLSRRGGEDAPGAARRGRANGIPNSHRRRTSAWRGWPFAGELRGGSRRVPGLPSSSTMRGRLPCGLGWAKCGKRTEKTCVNDEVRADISKALKLDNKCIDAVFLQCRNVTTIWAERERREMAFRKVL